MGHLKRGGLVFSWCDALLSGFLGRNQLYNRCLHRQIVREFEAVPEDGCYQIWQRGASANVV